MNLKKSLIEEINKSKRIRPDAKLILQNVLADAEYHEKGIVAIEAIAEGAALSPEAARWALYSLADAGFAKLEHTGVAYVDAAGVEISATLLFRFVGGAEMPPKQGEFDLEEGKDADTEEIPAPILTREQLRRRRHWEEIESNGSKYRFVISPVRDPQGSDGVVGYSADVYVKDVGSDAPPVHAHQNQGPFPSETEAWKWWDEFWPGLAPELAAERLREFDDAPRRLYDRVADLEADDSGVVALSPETYDAFMRELYEGMPEDDSERIAAFASAEWRHCERTYVKREDGHSLAVDPESDSDEETPAEETGAPEYPLTLEDGSQVVARPAHQGQGWWNVVIVGPVNEAGEWRQRVRDKAIKDDPEGWSLRKAEELRKAFLESGGEA